MTDRTFIVVNEIEFYLVAFVFSYVMTSISQDNAVLFVLGMLTISIFKNDLRFLKMTGLVAIFSVLTTAVLI